MPDFTAHEQPVLAARCPEFGKTTGIWCHRPSEHRASNLQKARRIAPGSLFVAQLGEDASIECFWDMWIIDPNGRAGKNRLERMAGVQLELCP